MIFVVYIVFLFALSLGVLGSLFYSVKNGTSIGMKIARVEASSAAMLIISIISVFNKSCEMAVGLKSLYLISSQVMMYFIFSYVIEYMELKLSKVIRMGVITFVVVTCIMYMINPLHNNVFEMTKQIDNLGNEYFRVTKVKVFFYLYIAFFVFVTVSMMVILLARIFKSSKLYKRKYRAINMMVVVCLGVSPLFVHTNTIIDGYAILSAILCMFICYFSLHYIPRGLAGSTLSIISKDMESGILIFDIDGRCIYSNKIAEDFIKFSGRSYNDIENAFMMLKATNNGVFVDKYSFEDVTEKDGQKYYYKVTYHKIYDDMDKEIGEYLEIQDRTLEMKRFIEERYKATHDALTGFNNRENFFREVSAMLNENREEKFIIVCADIREFKLVNDLFGIEKGDEVIRKTADIIREYVEDNGIFGRLHGDRFAICMKEEGFDSDKFIESLNTVSEIFTENVYKLYFYIGAYQIVDYDEAPEIMCDKAYMVSEIRRNDYKQQVEYYDEEIIKKTIKEKRMVSEFDEAIYEKQFKVYLQPQTYADGKVVGAEALVRWEHPRLGFLNPGAFIENFEKTGLIHKLDQYVWREAAAQLKKWKNEGRTDMHISVNISAIDFYYIDIYEFMTNLVKEYDIDVKSLKLEITETAIMSDIKKNIPILRGLQEYGFEIEIDDFGSGYSSLNTLKDICADVVKIDMGFLRASENEKRSNVILKNIISMSNELDMSVITEGVETKEQLDKLKSMGCDMFQGYYFAKPMPIDEFEEKYM